MCLTILMEISPKARTFRRQVALELSLEFLNVGTDNTNGRYYQGPGLLSPQVPFLESLPSTSYLALIL